MSEPIRLSFEVSCPPERAFELWTARISTWWPTGHSVSRARDLEVVVEGRRGGRIFERTPSGEVHEWGTVTVWDPPSLLAYTWHLGADPTDPTDVAIHFTPAGGGGTRVEIDHGGWERLGVDGPRRRDSNLLGWEGVLPQYIAAADKGGRSW
jgi:uncharacterized protein YndB with AHSA1/START domain